MTGVAVLTDSAGATRELGALVAALLVPGDVLLLSGGLGAGKTTLTKGLVAALGSDEAVTSPTFTLMRTYATTPVVAHVDCWRMEQLNEVADLALDEVLDEGGVAVVEWGEAAAPLLGRDALEVVIEPIEGGPDGEPARLVRLAASSASWRERLGQFEVAARGAGFEVR
jgi:tRNA threonylcarbamoyladenosine biosynthesis protein TsaE